MAFTHKVKDSSAIAEIRWASWKLTVVFHKSGSYSYHQVPFSLAQEFVKAPSKGKFYNTKILNHFPCSKE